jgi:hypothetical protein
VAEAEALGAQDGLGAANRLGFSIEARVVELEGLCPACRLALEPAAAPKPEPAP